MIRPPLSSTLFPYTTLFRSWAFCTGDRRENSVGTTNRHTSSVRWEMTNFTFQLVRNVKLDRKSTRLNSSHANISYAVFCLKKKKNREAEPHGDSRQPLSSPE